MDGKWSSLGVAFLVVFAGCATAAAATGGELKDVAASRASSWDSRAKLAGMIGVEGTFDLSGIEQMLSGSGQSDAWKDAHWSGARSDERVGDGRCELWAYLFVAEGKASMFVVFVNRSRDAFRTFEFPTDDAPAPLSSWKLDSDEALAAAKAANEGLRRGVESENFGVVEGLTMDEDANRPVWFVAGGGGDAGGGGGGFVMLDANTGEVLATYGGFGPGGGSFG